MAKKQQKQQKKAADKAAPKAPKEASKRGIPKRLSPGRSKFETPAAEHWPGR